MKTIDKFRRTNQICIPCDIVNDIIVIKEHYGDALSWVGCEDTIGSRTFTVRIRGGTPGSDVLWDEKIRVIDDTVEILNRETVISS